MTRNYHIVYIAEDGITTLVSGVGTIAQNFLLAFPTVADEFAKEEISLSLSLITLKATQETIGFRDDLRMQSIQLTKKFNGSLYEITPQKTKQYFSQSAWRNYNKMARAIIQAEVKKYDHLIVIVNDPIFGFSVVDDKKVVTIIVPHSLAAIHRQSYLPLRQRMQWERRMLRQAKNQKNTFVGYTSYLWHEVFLSEYRLPITKLVPFYNGFADPFLRSYQVPQSQLKQTLKRNQIPTNQDLIVGCARPDEYKGLDTTLKAMIAIAKEQKLHPVLIASGFSNEAVVAKIQRELQGIAQKSPVALTLRFGYEFDLPKLLLRWTRTRYLLNLPLRDFNPLLPLEGVRLGHRDLVVLNSDLPCHRVHFVDDYNGFLVKPITRSIVQKLRSIKRKTQREKRTIIQRGRQEIKALTDVSENILLGISSVLNEHEFSAGAVITRKKNGYTQILLVEHKDNTYVFVKGHIEAGEMPRQAAVREVFEEVGLKLKPRQLSKPRTVSRMTWNKSGQRTLKHITIFQAQIKPSVKLLGGEEVGRWFYLSDALRVMRYPEDRLLLSNMEL